MMVGIRIPAAKPRDVSFGKERQCNDMYSNFVWGIEDETMGLCYG